MTTTPYRNARTLPEALAVDAKDPAWRGSCICGATKADLLYDYDHGLLLIGADAGGAVASAPGINGHLPAMSSRLFIPHAVNMMARKEAMAQTEIFIRDELPRFFDQDDMQKAIAANQDKVSRVRPKNFLFFVIPCVSNPVHKKKTHIYSLLCASQLQSKILSYGKSLPGW